jgi:hypothetical protein
MATSLENLEGIVTKVDATPSDTHSATATPFVELFKGG